MKNTLNPDVDIERNYDAWITVHCLLHTKDLIQYTTVNPQRNLGDPFTKGQNYFNETSWVMKSYKIGNWKMDIVLFYTDLDTPNRHCDNTDEVFYRVIAPGKIQIHQCLHERLISIKQIQTSSIWNMISGTVWSIFSKSYKSTSHPFYTWGEFHKQPLLSNIVI